MTEIGFKMHMNDIAATIGMANFPHLESNLQKLRENAKFYQTALSGIPGLTLLDIPDSALSSFWLFSFHIQNKLEFIDYMKNQGVVVSQVHARNDTHTACAPFRTYLPNLDRVEKTFISIPVGWWLTKENLEHIASSIQSFCSTLLCLALSTDEKS